MAFKALPKFQTPGRASSNDVTVAVFCQNKQGSNYYTAAIGIPAAVLKQAGLDGAGVQRVSLLVGEGADFGSIALVPGDGLRVALISKSTGRVEVRTTRIAAGRDYHATACQFEVGRSRLIVHFPADFPWADQFVPAAVERAPIARRIEAGIGAAA